MIDVEKHIYNLLGTDPALANQIGSGQGVTFQFPQVEFKPPAIVYFEINQADVDFSDNKARSNSCDIQISVLVKQGDKAKEMLISHRVYEILRQYQWVLTGSTSIGAQYQGCQHKVMRFTRIISDMDNI